jgi:hypothetical protein
MVNLTVNTALFTKLKKSALRNQTQKVIAILQTRHSASVAELKGLGISNPSAVIKRLRENGYRIRTFYRKGKYFLGRKVKGGEYRYILFGKTAKGGVK